MRMMVIAATLLIASTAVASAQGGGGGGAGAAGSATGGTAAGAGPASNEDANSMNPAARGMNGVNKDAPGTDVHDATGTNHFTGQAVGVPLQPNDLGSPEQRSKE